MRNFTLFIILLLSTLIHAQNPYKKFQGNIDDVKLTFLFYEHKPVNEDEAKQMIEKLLYDEARFTFNQYMLIYLNHYDVNKNRSESDEQELRWEKEGEKMQQINSSVVSGIEKNFPKMKGYYDAAYTEFLKNVAQSTLDENKEKIKKTEKLLKKGKLSTEEYAELLTSFSEMHVHAMFYDRLPKRSKTPELEKLMTDYQKKLIEITRLYMKKYPKKS